MGEKHDIKTLNTSPKHLELLLANSILWFMLTGKSKRLPATVSNSEKERFNHLLGWKWSERLEKTL